MPFSTILLNGAACAGKLSTVIWLHAEHTCALHSTSLCCARAGQIEVLRWLKQQCAQFGEMTMCSAAMHGQTLTCAYLHAEGCKWDDVTVQLAASRKCWDTVRWLHEHGCPWNLCTICLKAADQGSIEMITYILQQEVVSAALLSGMLNAAAQMIISQQRSGYDSCMVLSGLIYCTLVVSLGQVMH